RSLRRTSRLTRGRSGSEDVAPDSLEGRRGGRRHHEARSRHGGLGDGPKRWHAKRHHATKNGAWSSGKNPKGARHAGPKECHGKIPKQNQATNKKSASAKYRTQRRRAGEPISYTECIRKCI